MRTPIIYACILLFVASCVKETDWHSPPEAPGGIVVEAMITSEVKPHIIKISRPATQLNGPVEAVAGATVLLSDPDSTWAMEEVHGEPGSYRSPAWLYARPGRWYTLFIEAGGMIHTAKARMVKGADFIPLRYTPAGLQNRYRLAWVAQPYHGKKPAMYEVLLDWSDVPGYQLADTNLARARLLYYTLPSIDVSQIFAPALERVTFPAGTVITEKRYSLTMEHASYIRELLLETQWQGGLFPSAPANLQGNISGGAWGYFSVCALNSKTLLVSP